MPNFKPKSKKKIRFYTNYVTTLDFKHQTKMKEFDDIEKLEIPKLQLEKKKLKRKMKKLKNIEDKMQTIDDIKKIRKTIKILKRKKNDYLLNNSKYIFEYFEKKKDVSEGNGHKTVLNSFFKKEENITQKSTKYPNDVQRYMRNLDENNINMNDFMQNFESCKYCSSELVTIDHEGIMVCKSCFSQIPFFIENIKPSYKEPPKEVCFYAYKRINHFREILAQFQAKETTQIPDEVIKDIKDQIKKERISIKSITNKKAKDILKKLGYNKFYEHIPFIKDKLGIKPPVMSPELEDKLCNLFMEIQRPYAIHCPEGRVNFLNYYYVLYKLCELLDEITFLEFFPMLKDPVKRIEQDEIWKKICKELNWEYRPTI